MSQVSLTHICLFDWIRYFPVDVGHLQSCNQDPGKCLQCQLAKIADGLLSGRYSTPTISESGEVQGQDGIAPGMFKALVGRGHPEFSTMRQQVCTILFRIIKSVHSSMALRILLI